eukprot:g2373.t1
MLRRDGTNNANANANVNVSGDVDTNVDSKKGLAMVSATTVSGKSSTAKKGKKKALKARSSAALQFAAAKQKGNAVYTSAAGEVGRALLSASMGIEAGRIATVAHYSQEIHRINETAEQQRERYELTAALQKEIDMFCTVADTSLLRAKVYAQRQQNEKLLRRERASLRRTVELLRGALAAGDARASSHREDQQRARVVQSLSDLLEASNKDDDASSATSSTCSATSLLSLQ